MNTRTKYENAGKRMKLRGTFTDHMGGTHDEVLVEDYWINLEGRSWMDCNGNPACMIYGIRTGLTQGLHGEGIPTDDHVVYGKTGRFGNLFHVSELGDVINQ